MQKFAKTFELFFKACIRRLGTKLDVTPKPRTVDIEAKLVYGGDLPEEIPVHTQSFGSLLFSRMMRPERREAIFQVNSLTNDSMTTKACLESSVGLAERLQEEGVKKGDFVLLVGNNSLNMNIALLGILFLGAVPLPLTYKTNLDEIEIIVKSMKPKYFGCDSNYLYSVKKVITDASLIDVANIFLLSPKRIPVNIYGSGMWGVKVGSSVGFEFGIFLAGIFPRTYNEGSEHRDLHIDDPSDPNIEGFAHFIQGRGKNFESFKPAEVSDPKKELVLLMKAMTEGQIGRVVGITHHNLNSVIARYDAENRNVKLGERVILMVQKVIWMSGIYTLILSCCFGSKLVLMSEFDEENFMKAVHDHKVTTTFLYSSKCWQLYKHTPKNVYDLSSCKHFIAIDGSLPKFLMDGLKEKLGVIPRPSYGITELSGIVLEPDHNTKEGSTGKLVPQTYGKVVSGETFKNAGPNVKGELCFKGPILTRGFINDEKSNKSLLDKDGFLLSGHYGYYDEDGDFYIIDKIIHQIKYKTFKISPKELEGIIKTLDAIKDVCVAGLSHPKDGECPVAFVSLAKGQKITEKEIINYVKDKVPEHKQLIAVFFVSKIPRFRDSGGIKRNIFKKALSKYRIKADDSNVKVSDKISNP